MLVDRGVTVEADFLVEHIEDTTLVSYDGREVPFDLLVTVPLNMGADFVTRSGLGDELGFVPVDKHTLQSTRRPADLRGRGRLRHPHLQGGIRRALLGRTSSSTTSSSSPPGGP